MADTDKLTAALDDIKKRYEVWGDASDVPRLLAALDAVLAKHQPAACLTVRPCDEHMIFAPLGEHLDPDVRRNCAACEYREWQACAECGSDEEWPCGTYQAISRELLKEGTQ